MKFSRDDIFELLKLHSQFTEAEIESNDEWLVWVTTELSSVNELIERDLVPPALIEAFTKSKDGAGYLLQISSENKSTAKPIPNPTYYAGFNNKKACWESVTLTPDLTNQKKTPYSLLVSDNASYVLDDLIAYFLCIVRVMTSIQTDDEPSIIAFAKSIFDHCHIARKALQGINDPDCICENVAAFSRSNGYLANEGEKVALTQKGRLFLRNQYEHTSRIVDFIGQKQSKIRIHLVIEDSELLGITVDGEPKKTSGQFRDALNLLCTLWNSTNHRMSKAEFDKKHHGNSVRYKGKSQLQNKLSASVLKDIFQDDAYGGDIWLTDAIEIVMKDSTCKR